MTQLTRQEYTAALRGRYGFATKKEKSGILDEFCRVTGCHCKAAERAGEQGKSWPYHDRLFSTGGSLFAFVDGRLKAYVLELGHEEESFNTYFGAGRPFHLTLLARASCF